MKQFLLYFLVFLTSVQILSAQSKVCPPTNTGANLVPNPSFELGKDGSFTSGFNPPTNTCNVDCSVPEGGWGVVTDAYKANNSWMVHFNPKDGSNMLIVDVGTTTDNKCAWSTTIPKASIVPNTVYFFSAYLANVSNQVFPNDNAPKLIFNINGTDIGAELVLPSNTTAGAGNKWVQFFATWISPATVPANDIAICLENRNKIGGGNDLAIDDISFSTSCKDIENALAFRPKTKLVSGTSICLNGGEVELNTGLGTTNLKFSWKGPGPDGTTAPARTETTPKITVNTPGTYYVCIDTLNSGCPQPDSVVVNANFPLTLPDFELCSPPVATFNTGITKTSYFNSIKWYKGTTEMTEHSGKTSVSVSTPGDYKVVIDAPGTSCDVTATSTVTTVAPEPVDGTFCPAEGGKATLSINGTGGYKWFTTPTGNVVAGRGKTITTPALTAPGPYTFYVQDTTKFKAPAGYSSSGLTCTGTRSVDQKDIGLWLEGGTTDVKIDSITLEVNFNAPCGDNLAMNWSLYNKTTGTTTNKPFILKETVCNTWTTVRVPVGVTLKAGNVYALNLAGSAQFNLRYCTAPAGTYPKTYSKNGFDLVKLQGSLEGVNNDGKLGGVGNSGSEGQARQNYPGYFDMEVSTGPECDRVPVVARLECPPCEKPTALNITSPATASATLCAGDDLTLKFTETLGTSRNGGYTYLWYKKGTTPGTPGTTKADYTLNDVTTAAAGFYKIRITDGGGTDPKCYLEDSIEVIVNPLPVASITTTKLEYCADDKGITLTAADAGSTATYEWFKGTNSQGTASGTRTLGPVKAGDYTVKVLLKGCADTSTKVTVKENPEPDASITTSGTALEYCEGTTGVTLTATSTPANAADTYQWIKGTTNQGTASTAKTLANALKGDYTVFVKTPAGCIDTSAKVTVKENPLPKGGSIKLTDTICIGAPSEVYTISGVTNATDYNWTLPSGASFVADTAGAGTNSVTVNFGTAKTGNITVTPVNACGPGTKQTIVISYFDTPKGGQIVIPDTVCSGEMVNVSTQNVISGLPLTSISWQLPVGATSVGTVGAFSIGVKFQQSGTPVIATPNNMCGAGEPIDTAVLVIMKPGNAGDITGADKICNNQEENYSIDPVIYAAEYEWKITPALPASDFTPNKEKVRIKFGTATSYTLTVTPKTYCGSGQPATLVINNDGLPVPEITLTQLPSPVCSDATVKIAAAVKSGGATPVFKWLVGTATNPSGNDTLEITNPEDGVPVMLTMTSSLSCASPKTVSKSINLKVQPAPSKAAINEADFTTCAKDTILTAAVPSSGTGKWSVRTGDPASVGADGKVSLTADANTEKTARIYYTVATTGNACKPTVDSLDIKIKPIIPAPSAGQDKTICVSAGTLQLSGSAVKAGETGTWSAAGTAAVSASGLATFTQAGEFEFVYKVDNGFCSKDDKVKITVDAEPSAPLINEGTEKQTCINCEKLTAAAVATGTRSWSVTPASVKLTSVTDSSEATFCDLPQQSVTNAVVTLKVRNGVCPAKTTTFIFKRLNELTQPLAGQDQTVCEDKTAGVTLKALSVLKPANGHEKGSWSAAGPASVNSNDGINATVSGLILGENKFIFKVVNDNCPEATDTVIVKVEALPADPGSIAGEDTVCGEVSGKYEIPAVSGATKYNWTISGPGKITTGAGTRSITVKADAVTARGKITLSVKAENNCGESDNASTFEIEVYPNLKPEVSIEADHNSICADSSATFTVTNVSAETAAPVFTWMLKSGSTETVKGAGDEITLGGLKNGDKVYVKMESDYRCAVPDVVSSAEELMEVIPMKVVSVNIEAVPGGPVCAGTPVIFKAKPVYPGSAPVYKWTIGTAERVGDTDDSVLTALAQTSDITVELTSNERCFDNQKAQKIIRYEVMPLTPMEMKDLPVTSRCEGRPATALSIERKSGTDLGSNPQYSWELTGNGIVMTGVSKMYTPDTDLPAGEYDIKVIVTTNAQCPAKKSDTVKTKHTVNPNPVAEIEGGIYYCPGQSQRLTARENDMDYSWTGGSASGKTTQEVDVTEGTYRVLVTNSLTGCNTLSDPHEVLEFSPHTSIIATPGDAVKCAGQSVDLKVAVTGKTYNWTVDNIPHTDDDADGSKIRAIVPGLYKVSVIFEQGGISCPAEATILVTDLRTPAPFIGIEDKIICENKPLWISARDPQGDLGPVKWYKAGSDLTIEEDTGSYLVRQTGSYYATQSNGRCSSFSDTVNVIVDRVPLVSIDPHQQAIVAGNTATLNGTNKLSDITWYNWTSVSIGHGSNIPLLYDGTAPVITVSPVVPRTKFYLTAASENGACIVRDSAVVTVEIPLRPWNSLSPNGDGVYDTWNIDYIGEYSNALIEVYNRWGNLVWKSKGYAKPWNGTNFRNGELLPVATYYYVIYPNGEAVNDPLTGDVTIVR
jgi:gliding motility-associated-like protein